MKTRIIVLLLLFVITLTACASDSGMTKPSREPQDMHRSEDASAPTESARQVPDVDMGAIDGNTYKNVALNISVTFPSAESEGWHIYDEDQITRENAFVLDVFDRAAIADAVNAGEEVRILHASALDPEAHVYLTVSKNPLPGEDPDALVNHFMPQVKAFFEDAGLKNAAYVPHDADFCEEDHIVLSVSNESPEAPYHISYVYLPCGDLLYTLSIEAEQETVNSILLLFEPLD